MYAIKSLHKILAHQVEEGISIPIEFKLLSINCFKIENETQMNLNRDFLFRISSFPICELCAYSHPVVMLYSKCITLSAV